MGLLELAVTAALMFNGIRRTPSLRFYCEISIRLEHNQSMVFSTSHLVKTIRRTFRRMMVLSMVLYSVLH